METNESLSVDELIISSITAESIEEIVEEVIDPETAELPTPKQV